MATKKKRVATIQVPTAPARPGDKPKFAAWTNQPGDLSRPDPLTCTAADTTDHAHGLVRVLDDEGKASGPWNPDLSPDELRTGLEHMVRMRIFDDRMMKMQRTGKLSFYMRSLGEECVAVAQTMALETQDWIFPTYRQPAAQFVRGRDMVSMICHCIGNEKDNILGRQMPVHYSYRTGRYISVSSPVATQFSQAVGVAMASDRKSTR
jgi:2-oxoisovalerate dehydrogenase E1 component alpha subunit